MNSKMKADLSYRTFDELRKASEEKRLKKEDFARRTICTTLLKLYDSGVSYMDLGDEEKAYIMLMRFFDAYQLVRKSGLYTQEKAYVDNIIDFKKVKKSLDHLEAIKESLVKRYKKLEENEQKLAREKEEKSAPKILPEQAISPILSKKGFITPTELKDHVSTSNYRFMIVDIRSKAEFDYSHINFTILLSDTKKKQNLVDYMNLPAEIIENVSWKIEETLKKSPSYTATHKTFSERADYDYIVVLDKDSTSNYSMEPESKLLMLKKAIYDFDQDVKLKNEPLILDGGWLGWISYFPGFSTSSNPDFKPVEPTHSNDRMIGFKKILDFDYPSPTEPRMPKPAPVVDVVKPDLFINESSTNEASFGYDDTKVKPLQMINKNIVSIPVVNRQNKPANSVITQSYKNLNIREPIEPSYVNPIPLIPALVNTPSSSVPVVKPQPANDSSAIFASVYRPFNSFQSPLIRLKDGSKKILDLNLGVYKYVKEAPGEISTKANPVIPPVVDYSTKPRLTVKNNNDSENNPTIGFRTNLKRTLSIPNIANLNEEFVPSESSVSGRVYVHSYV